MSQPKEPPWILVLCHEFPPLGGGAGKNLFLLCRELTRLGLRVKVWTTDPGIKKRRIYDFEVHYFNLERQNRFETSLKGMALYLARAILHGRTFLSDKPTLILSVLGIPAGLAGMMLSTWARIPHFVWYHGSDIHAGHREGPGLWQKFLLRRIWKRSTINLFVAQGLLDRSRNMGLTQAAAILPACPAPEILASPISNGASGDKRYFLFLGRFDPVKNPMLPLQAMLELKNKGKVIYKLRMVGSGILSAELQQFVRRQALSEIVALEGAASFSHVPDLLRSAYALILPSQIEGFNTTLLEAAHFGVPAIATDTFGIREFVTHMETGYLFEADQSLALAAAMEALAADSNLRDALGQKAKQAALPYKPEQVAQTFLSQIAIVPGLANKLKVPQPNHSQKFPDGEA